MNYIFILLLLIITVQTTRAGLPPTTSKGAGDANPFTTFFTDYGTIPLIHTGTNMQIGTIPISQGGTGSTTQNFVDLTNAQTVGGAKNFTSPVTTNDVLFNDPAYNTITLKKALSHQIATGVIDGAILSINADPTKFDLSQQFLSFSDYSGGSNLPVVKYVTCAALTAQTVTNIAVADTSYISITPACAVVQSTTFPTQIQRRTNAFIGRLAHLNHATVTIAATIPDFVVDTNSQLYDLFDAMGAFNISGNIISPNGANMSFNKSAGVTFRRSVGYPTNKQNPNTINIPAAVPASFVRLTQTTLSPGPFTLHDAANYDVAGVVTPLGGPTARSSNARIYLFSSGTIAVQYGQAFYPNLATAVSSIANEAFVVNPQAVDGGILLAVLSCIRTATDISNPAQCQLSRVGRFDQTGVTTGALSATTLQQAYDNSVTPQITTTVTSGSVNLKRGTAADTDNVVTVQNGAGTTTASITGEGTVSSVNLSTSANINENVSTDAATTGANATMASPQTPIVRLTNVSLTSIDTISSPTPARVLTGINLTGAEILLNNDTGATAANRILTGTGQSYRVPPQGTFNVKYDNIGQRWMLLSSKAPEVVNYVTKGNAESGPVGWARYANTVASAIPETGTGGAPNPAFLLDTTTTLPIQGLKSYLVTKDANSRIGHGVSYDFTTDRSALSSIQTISMDYEVSSAYADTVSGNLINSDMQVFVYDVTNLQLIYCDTQNIAATTTTGHLVTTFQTNVNSQSYRLIYHVASINPALYTLKFDNVSVAPKVNVKGAIATDWISYTPIWTSSTPPAIGNGTIVGKYRRVGDSIDVQIDIISGTTTTYGTGTWTWSLPPGLTVDTNKVSAAVEKVGDAKSEATAGLTSLHGSVHLSGTSAIYVQRDNTSTAGGWSGIIPQTYAASTAGQIVNIHASNIPIVGWSSNVALSEDSGNRQIATRARRTTTQNVTSVSQTKILLSSASSSTAADLFDTAGSFDAANNRISIVETGYYSLSAKIQVSNLTAGERARGYIDVNGASVTVISVESLPSTIATIPLITHRYLTKGSYVELSVQSDVDTAYDVSAGDSSTYLEVIKLSSPQTLAGSETVAMRAVWSGAGQNIPNNSATFITWNASKTYDTHNAMVSATGIFTAPVSGYYQVNARITAAFSTASVWELGTYKNGNPYSHQDTVATSTGNIHSVSFSDNVFLAKGDTFRIGGYQNSGGTVALTASALYNFLSINLVK
jgi:hypothetical protein